MDAESAKEPTKAAEALESQPSETAETSPDAKNAEGSKVKRIDVFRSGWMNEPDLELWGYKFQGRAFTQEYLRQIVENTVLMQGKAGLRVPILRGHPELEHNPEQGQAVDGWLADFAIEELEELDPQGRPQVKVTAIPDMMGDLADDFANGRLPKRSPYIELFGGKLPDGRAVGPYFKNLALLGKDTPAMGAMMDSTYSAHEFQLDSMFSVRLPKSPAEVPADASKGALTDFFKSFTDKISGLVAKVNGLLKSKKALQAQEADMPDLAVIKEQLIGCMDYLAEGQRVLQDAITALDEGAVDSGDAPEGEEDMTEGEMEGKDKEGTQDEKAAAAAAAASKTKADKANSAKGRSVEDIKALHAETAKDREIAALKEQAARSRFGALCATGHILKGQEQDFLDCAGAFGIEKAEKMLAGTPIQAPGGRLLTDPAANSAGPTFEQVADKLKASAARYGTSTATYSALKAELKAMNEASALQVIKEIESPRQGANMVRKGA